MRPIPLRNRPTNAVREICKVSESCSRLSQITLRTWGNSNYLPNPLPSPPIDITEEGLCCVQCAYQTLITEAGVNLETFLNPNDTLVTASESEVEFNWGLAYRFSRIVVTVDPHGFGIPEIPLIYDIGHLNRAFTFDCVDSQWVPTPEVFAMPVIAEDSDYIPDPVRLRLWYPTCPALTPGPVDFGLDTVGWDEYVMVKLVQLIVPALELEEMS